MFSTPPLVLAARFSDSSIVPAAPPPVLANQFVTPLIGPGHVRAKTVIFSNVFLGTCQVKISTVLWITEIVPPPKLPRFPARAKFSHDLSASDFTHCAVILLCMPHDFGIPCSKIHHFTKCLLVTTNQCARRGRHIFTLMEPTPVQFSI